MGNSIAYETSGVCGVEFAPSKLRYNDDGVPILSGKQIELIAHELLKKHCPIVLRKPTATPVVEIIEKLRQRTGLLFAMEDLGWVGVAKVLGKVSFTRKTLYLDVSLNGERSAAFRFTAAHEIGHWVLHRYNYKNWKFKASSRIEDNLQDDEKTLCRLERNSPKDWLEIQANIFAASLIMPRDMVIVALSQAQKTIGITKNLGKIYLSNNPSSRRDYDTAVNHLCSVFGVSKKSVRVRIKTLQLVEGKSQSDDEIFQINPFTILAPFESHEKLKTQRV